MKNTNEDPVALNMIFSVTQIKNPATAFESKYLVTAGAEYDKETYVWIGQSEVTVHNSSVSIQSTIFKEFKVNSKDFFS